MWWTAQLLLPLIWVSLNLLEELSPFGVWQAGRWEKLGVCMNCSQHPAPADRLAHYSVPPEKKHAGSLHNRKHPTSPSSRLHLSESNWSVVSSISTEVVLRQGWSLTDLQISPIFWTGGAVPDQYWVQQQRQATSQGKKCKFLPDRLCSSSEHKDIKGRACVFATERQKNSWYS